MGLEEELNQLIFGVREMLWAVIVIAVLILIIFVIILLERKLKRMIELRKKSRIFYYRKEIKKLNKLINPQKALDAINELAKNFFKEAFNLPHSLEYSELTEEFRKTGKKECISFCKLLLELNYSGEKIKKEQLKALISLLEKIVEKNRIPGEEALEEAKRKEEEKQKIIEKYKPKKIFKEKILPKIKNLREKTQKIKLPKLKLEEEEIKEKAKEIEKNVPARIERKPKIPPPKKSKEKEIKPKIIPQKISKEKTTKPKRGVGGSEEFDSMSSIKKKIEELRIERGQ